MLTAAIEFAGPSNYCPVLAGAIGGARWGASTISNTWFPDKLFLAKIRETAEQLAKGWEIVS
jgi:hypothetical protein